VRREISSFDQESGRGLMLVEALSKDWGVYPKDGGKVVWVMLLIDESDDLTEGGAGYGAGGN
jgi:hypothetical protein